MWPGQQPPGGEQNPQEPNPYQHPGHPPPHPQQQPGQQPAQQQPNPYQQPAQPPNPYQTGEQYPNPYQQPPNPYQQPPQSSGTHPAQQPSNPYQQPDPQQGPYAQAAQFSGGPTGAPPGPPPPPQNTRKRSTAIAIGAVVAVVAVAGVAVYFLTGDDDKKENAATDQPTASVSSSTSSSPSPRRTTEEPDEEDNPRVGGKVEPVVPGWKAVVNRKRHNAFDVPPSWKVDSPGMSVGIGDDKDDTGMKMLVVMSAPANYKRAYCTISHEGGYKEKSALAEAGTKGAQGAKNKAEAAETEALNWVYAAYDQKKTGTFKSSKATTFSSDHGLRGKISKATVTGVKKTDKCSTDGKAYALTYTDTNGDYATWVLYAAKGVKDEVPDKTIKKIMKSLRPLEPSS